MPCVFQFSHKKWITTAGDGYVNMEPHDVVIHPRDRRTTFYVTSEVTGIHKTTDGGTTIAPIEGTNVPTIVPGMVDYVKHEENGLLVEPGNERALADAVLRLLENPSLARRLAHRALADIRERHTAEDHALARLEAIQQLWVTASPSLPRSSGKG